MPVGCNERGVAAGVKTGARTVLDSFVGRTSARDSPDNVGNKRERRYIEFYYLVSGSWSGTSEPSSMNAFAT